MCPDLPPAFTPPCTLISSHKGDTIMSQSQCLVNLQPVQHVTAWWPYTPPKLRYYASLLGLGWVGFANIQHGTQGTSWHQLLRPLCRSMSRYNPCCLCRLWQLICKHSDTSH